MAAFEQTLGEEDASEPIEITEDTTAWKNFGAGALAMLVVLVLPLVWVIYEALRQNNFWRIPMVGVAALLVAAIVFLGPRLIKNKINPRLITLHGPQIRVRQGASSRESDMSRLRWVMWFMRPGRLTGVDLFFKGLGLIEVDMQTPGVLPWLSSQGISPPNRFPFRMPEDAGNQIDEKERVFDLTRKSPIPKITLSASTILVCAVFLSMITYIAIDEGIPTSEETFIMLLLGFLLFLLPLLFALGFLVRQFKWRNRPEVVKLDTEKIIVENRINPQMLPIARITWIFVFPFAKKKIFHFSHKGLRMQTRLELDHPIKFAETLALLYPSLLDRMSWVEPREKTKRG